MREELVLRLAVLLVLRAVLLVLRAALLALVALLALDAELAQLVATTTEPLLGEIRLAWWRDRLIELDTQPAPAQPLLQALQARTLPRLSGSDLAGLEDGWLARLNGDAAGSASGCVRLFALAARLLGADPAEGEYLGRALALAQSPPDRTSVLLRPLRAHAPRRVAHSTTATPRRAPNISTASQTAPAHKQTQTLQRRASCLQRHAQ